MPGKILSAPDVALCQLVRPHGGVGYRGIPILPGDVPSANRRVYEFFYSLCVLANYSPRIISNAGEVVPRLG